MTGRPTSSTSTFGIYGRRSIGRSTGTASRPSAESAIGSAATRDVALSVRLRPRTLRGRLTLVLAFVTAVLCLLVGVLVDYQYRNALRDALDDGLVTRFENLERDLATSGDLAVEPALPDDEAFAQIVGPDGEVVNAAPRALLDRRVLTKQEFADAQTHRITVERSAAPGDQRSRLLAGPAGQRGLGLVVVVGTSLQEATQAQHRLELALVVGLPFLAVIVSVAGETEGRRRARAPADAAPG